MKIINAINILAAGGAPVADPNAEPAVVTPMNWGLAGLLITGLVLLITFAVVSDKRGWGMKPENDND